MRALTAVGRPLVLLVDDDVRTALMLTHLLRSDGFDVDFAANGTLAMNRLARDPLPDALITDMSMPGADGVAVTRFGRSRRADLPVFVLTGYPLLVTAAGAIEPPPVVLTKPLDYGSFIERLRTAIRDTTVTS